MLDKIRGSAYHLNTIPGTGTVYVSQLAECLSSQIRADLNLNKGARYRGV